MKKTRWFPPSTLPVRSGVYEIGLPLASPWFRFFDVAGRWWYFGSETPAGALASRMENKSPAVTLPAKWRGLEGAP